MSQKLLTSRFHCQLLHMGLSSGVGPLWFSIGCIAYNIDNLFPLVVHAWRQWLDLDEEQPISVHWGTNSCEHLGMPKWVWPSINQYRMFFDQNLHTTSKHAPNSYQTWKVLYVKQPNPNLKSCWDKGYLYWHVKIEEKTNQKIGNLNLRLRHRETRDKPPLKVQGHELSLPHQCVCHSVSTV